MLILLIKLYAIIDYVVVCNKFLVYLFSEYQALLRHSISRKVEDFALIEDCFAVPPVVVASSIELANLQYTIQSSLAASQIV